VREDPLRILGKSKALVRSWLHTAWVAIVLAALSVAGLTVLAAFRLGPQVYLAFLGSMALWSLVVVCLSIIRRWRESEACMQRLAQLASHPGARSSQHLYLKLRLDEEEARNMRYGGLASVLCIGVDFAGSLGDLRAPEASDSVVEAVRICVSRLLRNCDVLSQVDDCVLTALLPDTDRRKARVAAERLRQSIEETAYEVEGVGKVDSVRLSIGIAAFPINGEAMDNVMSAAHKAMDRARELGGNAVVVSHLFIRSDEVGRPLVKEVRGQKVG